MGLTFQNVNNVLDLCAHNIPTCIHTHTNVHTYTYIYTHTIALDELVDVACSIGSHHVRGWTVRATSLSDGIFYKATYQSDAVTNSDQGRV